MQRAGQLASASDIDAIFERFDDDGGGTLDADEAKGMIQGLREAGMQTEKEILTLERHAKSARARSHRMARRAMDTSLEGEEQAPVDVLGC